MDPYSPHDTYNYPHSYNTHPTHSKHSKHSNMSAVKMNTLIENVLEASITEAVRDVAMKMWPDKRSELEDFTDALMVKLGLAFGGQIIRTRRNPKPAADEEMPPLEPATDAADASSVVSTESCSGSPGTAAAEPVTEPVTEPKAAAAAERKRTVSKKMKDEFEAAGGDEKQLKAAMKAYKAASDEQVAVGWAAFSAPFRGGAAPAAAAPAAPAAPAPVTPPKKAAAAEPVVAPAKEKKPRAKSEKNFAWTPSAKKLFAETVEASGGTLSDLLKDRFAAHVNALTPDAYKVLAAVGHMRKFLTAAPVAEAAEPAPAAAAPVAAPAADDDEDMESFEFEGEELFIGVTSGKVYRQTESSGDQLIGVAGEGRFKDVKKPAAE